jgi:hypothetical protein
LEAEAGSFWVGVPPRLDSESQACLTYRAGHCLWESQKGKKEISGWKYIYSRVAW